MTDQHGWDEIEALFFGALARDPAEREAYLRAACAGATELRREIEGMLAAHEGEGALLLERRLLLEPPTEVPVAESLLGTRVDPYRLKALLGRGGMGEVYLAERDDDQYRQVVALKLVRSTQPTADLVARFRAERQILARLTHPNIAHLLDGGVTEDGRPYLVMPYVAGIPITDYCDAHRLPVEQRLRLVRTVCEAVQYAHQNLVVHRDLKPSNILVTEGGHVQLLDFGIAKLLDPDAAEEPRPLTDAAQRVMTPEYAAPEQVRGDSITTATDVYALGLLLYELLTGHSPHQWPTRMQADIERVICEVAPHRPSTIVGRSTEMRRRDGTTHTLSPEMISRARRTQPRRLRRLLQGDLDNIVMMALRKEPERRYATAGQLTEDLERYLSGWPVRAQQDTLTYRLRKFAGRHRAGVGMAVALAVLLVGSGIVAAQQARTVAHERDRARAERDKAEQVVEVLVSLFETSNPTNDPGGDTLRVRTFLERGQAQVIGGLAEQPEIQARVKQVLGNLYFVRSQYDRARPLLKEALAQQRTIRGTSDPDAAAMLHDLARLAQQTGDLEQARLLFQESLDLHRSLYGDVHEKVAQCLQDVATVTQDEAEQYRLLQEALAMRQALLPAVHEGIANSLNQLGVYHHSRGAFGEASRYWREALDVLVRLRSAEHPHVLTIQHNLASVYGAMDSLDAAEALHRQNLSAKRRVLGRETVGVAASLSGLGTVLARKGAHADAEAVYREAVTLWTSLVGPEHWRTTNDVRNLGAILQLQRRYAEALPYLRQARDVSLRRDGPESRSAAYLAGQLAVLEWKMGQEEGALGTLRDTERKLRALAPSDGHYTLADAQVWLGGALLETGAARQAEPFFRNALAFRQATLSPDHAAIAAVQCALGRTLAAQGRFTEAEVLLRSAYPVFARWGLADADDVESTRRWLVQTRVALEQSEEGVR